MQTKNLTSVGIIGGGKMGKSIFNHLIKYPLTVTWICRSNFENERKRFEKRIRRNFEHGLISSEQCETSLNRTTITDDLHAISDCWLIIESVTEHRDVKNRLFSELESLISRKAIVATNSSSILPGEFDISGHLKTRFAGMHFFYPAETNSLLEIISTDDLPAENLILLQNFAGQTDKFVFVQNHQAAFACNRFFLDIQAGLFNFCTDSNISFEEADFAIGKHLFPTGIFGMMDLIGFEILQFSITNYIRFHDSPEHIHPLLNFISEKLNTGEHVSSAKARFCTHLPNEEELKNNREQEIVQHTNHLFHIFARKYTDKKIFTLEQMRKVITEYTHSDYSPL